MANRKLVNGLNQQVQKDLGKKLKLSFCEEKLDKELVDTLKRIFGTSSIQRVIEQAFNVLAIEELAQQDNIHGFPAYDYIQKLSSLEDTHVENDRAVYIPTWAVVATSNFIKSKYKKLEFRSIEEVIDLIISFTVDKTKSLWSSES